MMLYEAETLSQLREAVDAMIEACGLDAHVSTVMRDHSGKFIEFKNGEPVAVQCTPGDYLEGGMQLEYVYMDQHGRVVGTEAADYVMQPGDKRAVMVS